MSINNYYSTSDLALAGVLSLFYPIDFIDKNNPSKAVFGFKKDSNMDQVIESYWKGVLKVEPRAYFNQIKLIKSRLYE